MIASCRTGMARFAGLLICLSLTVPVAFSQTTDQDSTSRPAQDVAAQAQTEDSTSQAQQNPASSPCDPASTSGPAANDPCLQAQNQQPGDPTAPQVKPVAATYTPSLNGGPPILVQQPRHLRLLYGASTSQGYDSNLVGPFQNIGSYTSSYEGYLAASWRFTRSYVILQQDSSYTYFGSSLLEGHGFHQTSLLSTLDFDPNLNWTFEATSSEGNNTLTELIPLPTIVVGGIPVTSPGAATAGLNLGFVWGTDVASTLSWKPDSKDIYAFRAENANHQFYGLDLHDNLTTLELSYQRGLSQNTYLGGYGLTRHETGTIFCDSAGFGLIGNTRPTQRWFIEASGGPEFDSTGCRRHQGFELHLTTTYQLSRTSHLYATGNRQFSSGFVPNGTWEDNAGVGFSKQLTRRLTWDLGAGYARGFTGGFLVPASNSYHGFYEETGFVQRLSSSFTFEGLYRRFDQSVLGQSIHRNIVLFTLRWSPPSHDARRTAMYPYRPAGDSYDSRSGREE